MSFNMSDNSSSEGSVDKVDSVFPVDTQSTYGQVNSLAEDIGDAYFRANLKISGPSLEEKYDVGDVNAKLSALQAEIIINNQLLDETQFLGIDDTKRRNSLGQLSGIFTIGENIKRVPTLLKTEKSKLMRMINESPNYDPYTTSSMMWGMSTLILDLVDYGTDFTVAYLLDEETSTRWWFILTLIVVFVSLVLVNIFSIFWYYQDHRAKPQKIQRVGILVRKVSSEVGSDNGDISNKERLLLFFAHLTLLAPLYRHFQILFCGIQERKFRKKLKQKGEIPVQSKAQGALCYRQDPTSADDKEMMDYYTLRKYYERDSAYLGFMKAFLQDCPQLILQLYILAVRDHKTLEDPTVALYQIFSIVISLLSLSWSMVGFEQANRWANPDQPQMTMAACLIQMVWKFFMVASRVLVLALFATCFTAELFAFLGLHWILMTAWIIMMGTNFCGTAENRHRPVSEILYNAVMGFAATFEYLHLKHGPTRLKYFFYYTLMTVEGSALMSLWYLETKRISSEEQDPDYLPWSKENWYLYGNLAVVPGFFVVGLLFMGIYYRYSHPEGRMPNLKQKASLF